MLLLPNKGKTLNFHRKCLDVLSVGYRIKTARLFCFSHQRKDKEENDVGLLGEIFSAIKNMKNNLFRTSREKTLRRGEGG